jgi:predicted nucleic acid-binding protein
MITTNIALDTNILIYSHDTTDLYKQNIARDLILTFPVVSAQVVSEYMNVLRRIMTIPKDGLLGLCAKTLENTRIFPVDVTVIRIAERLVHRYDLQLFDSIIIASSIEAGCEILYSEDMQHDFLIEQKLRIINPFISLI